jgi:hypothetical protein
MLPAAIGTWRLAQALQPVSGPAAKKAETPREVGA